MLEKHLKLSHLVPRILSVEQDKFLQLQPYMREVFVNIDGLNQEKEEKDKNEVKDWNNLKFFKH